ncbi:MAG: pilus assembly PilX N-terminal domain-containing protein [Acidobacteriota bacterium]
MNRFHATQSPQPLPAEAGSAFVLALMAILILTILGLSVAVITETEMQLGAAEKNIQRAEYVAETGLWTKVAGLIAGNNWQRDNFALQEPRSRDWDLPNTQLGYAVNTTGVYTVANQCPAWTECGEGSESQGRSLRMFFVLTGARATRVGWPDSEPTPFEANPADVTPLGESWVSFGFFVGPIYEPAAREVPITQDGDSVDVAPFTG